MTNDEHIQLSIYLTAVEEVIEMSKSGYFMLWGQTVNNLERAQFELKRRLETKDGK